MYIHKKELNNSVSFEKQQNKPTKKSLEQKTVQANSLDALDSYGRAIINIGPKNTVCADFEERKIKLQKFLSSDYSYIKELLDCLIPDQLRYLSCLDSENLVNYRYLKDKEIDFINEESIDLAEEISFNKALNFPKGNAFLFLKLHNDFETKEERDEFKNFVFDLLKDNEIYENHPTNEEREMYFALLLSSISKDNFQLAKKVFTDKKLNIPKDSACEFIFKYNTFVNDEDKETFRKFVFDLAEQKGELADVFLIDYNIFNNDKDNEKFRKFALNIAKMAKNDPNPRFSLANVIFSKLNSEDLDLAQELLFDNKINFQTLEYSVLLTHYTELNDEDKKAFKDFVFEISPALDISKEKLIFILENLNKDNVDISKSICLGKLPQENIEIALELGLLYNKRNINEIPLAQKRTLLRKLVDCSEGMFSISSELKASCPLIPTNQEEYCALLPAIVKSIGIETNKINKEQKTECVESIFNMACELENMSDSDFNSMTVSQEYTKEEFIKDVFNILKDLSKEEKQKVYDYFGFELSQNKNGVLVDDNPENRFSIIGYPLNLNNGKKLVQIENKNTKDIVEKLRPYVIKFSENNHIRVSNSHIDEAINKITLAFPELRTMIDKKQHSVHSFDVMKHSLKVMQKIVQNPDFKNLNESDKKLMLLAALFHDITKAEGYRDKTHPDESSFDSYYILKKLGLSRAEEIKLNLLIKSHEWLAYTNNGKISKEDKIKRIESVAFDVQHANVFNMAKIFTKADLKAVKNDDSFFEKFKNAYEYNSKKIEEKIEILKASQPLFPITKFPKASQIESLIEYVCDNGSTNIKGVYKIDGNIVIRFNEVEDWQALGFPVGTASKGIAGNTNNNESYNTGNIHFFVHGLDYPNQLIKFNAFELPNSDALLSVSYAERPESKFRFFRKQGVILDVDNEFAYGGGETDSGSGFGKDINEFKKNYTFGGPRQADREYISNLIKNTLELDNKGYIEFVKQNNNKSMLEIEPIEVREKLIRAFASINSNTRASERAYNEMYLSNPRVMGVYAYPSDENNCIGNTQKFVREQEEFLKKYAKENDLPFVIFGF